MNKKILILGHKAYISLGLIEKLQETGFQVSCFSRGEEQKNGNIITGNVFTLTSNTQFDDHYDTVINFILLKDRNISENIRYLKSLTDFCELKKVKRLIHISSISVYANDEKYVNETTLIETNTGSKGMYSALKIEIDKYLSSINNPSFELCFVRPGFVISESIKSPLAGIAIKLPLNFCFLLGHKRTSLPLVDRDILQTALINIVKSKDIMNVYLLLKNNGGTKYSYLKDNLKLRVILMPKWLIFSAMSALKFTGILNDARYAKLTGLLKETYFDSSKTEKELNLKF
ncbi:MAG: NAD-dependent epimerase/dehydratase family protein [Bacteroidales bacterium]|jgi:nucleoside-diphosphate-sugar epimerase|nr:NAD-dependent epimerase/dehydratase family protein [Bacteroidales bacterium]